MVYEKFRTAGAKEVYLRSRDKGRMLPEGLSPFELLGPGSWSRKEADRSGGIVFKKNGRQTKISVSVLLPGSLG